MSERVPISKCNRCIRFRSNACPLQDLDPCRFVPRDPESEKAVDQFIIAVITICVCVIILCVLSFYKIIQYI